MERIDQLSAAIAVRLERVRGTLTDAQFAQLVADVARTAIRFEEIEARRLDPRASFVAPTPRPREPGATV